MAEAAVEAPPVGAEGGTTDKWLTNSGPKPGVKYPIRVLYCDVCDDWPVEYIEYHPHSAKAKEWMETHLSDEMKDLYVSEAGDSEEKKKRQTRGGRGVIKTKKKQDIAQKICLSRAPRGKKKSVTVVTGLATYEIDLKLASKAFGSKFACGSSVTGEDEIVIQGDVKDDLFDFIPEKWPQIDEDNIDDLGDQKRS